MSVGLVTVDRAMVNTARGVVLKGVGRVPVARKVMTRRIMARRRDAGLVADLAALGALAVRVDLAGRCRGLRRRAGRWWVRCIMIKVRDHLMSGSRAWSTSWMRF